MDTPERVKEDYPPEQFAMSGWTFVILVIIALFLPFLGPLLALLMGLLNWRRTGGIPLMIISILIIIAHIFILPPRFVQALEYSKIREVKVGLATIGNALDQYRNAHNGVFPADIQDLVTENIMSAFPLNPYSLDPMRNIPFGEEIPAGNFTYVPVTVNREVKGYYLMGYGAFIKGEDVNGDGKGDRVVQVLSSPNDTAASLPPLQDLIR